MPAKKSVARRGDPQPDPTQPSTLPSQGRPRRNAADDEIGRAQILSKYWELANLDPEVTKGTITGQLKALDSLCEELGFAPAERKRGETPPTQEIYRSAWMHSVDKRRDDE